MGLCLLAVLSVSAAFSALEMSAVFASGVEAEVNLSAIVSEYAEQCNSLGSTLATDANHPWTMTADLDGDGLQDYVINTQNLRCSRSATAFCGNGGCQIDVALSSQNFSDPVSLLGSEPTLIQSENAITLQIWVDRTNCDLTGDTDQQCWATYKWDGGALERSYAARHPR